MARADQAAQLGYDLLQDAEKYAKTIEVEEHQPNPKIAVRHWTSLPNFMWKVTELEHPLDGPTDSLELRKFAYAVNYHATSGYVHCSVWGLNNNHPDVRSPYIVGESSELADKNIPNDAVHCDYLLVWLFGVCTLWIRG